MDKLAQDVKNKVNVSYDRWTLQDPASVDYGHLGPTAGAGLGEVGRNHFYLTTAINYTNGPAHMGHAYEAATSDVIVRYHRLLGDASFFLTGADEHGQKIANTAADQGKVPIDICDKYVTGFKVLNQRLLISNDDYLRTTSDRHKATARALWQRCAAAGDVYLDQYSGWYNVREETFVTDNEAKLSDYKDPISGVPLKQVQEASYFFRMSKYQQQLIAHIESNPEFIQPGHHRNLILSRLKGEELRDLSISRTTFSWGISVPDGFEQDHVMYVWVDALSNYLTGVNGLQLDSDTKHLTQYWPANVHIIGKDILWFHTVIWPCLLLSADVALPRAVFAHGFVNDKDGKKMSKSLGNVVDPHDMLDKFEVDTFRWYLCREAPYGGELSFSQDSMRGMHNADLCDTFGNLVHRATNLCKKYCCGVVPDAPAPEQPPIDMASIVSNYKAELDSFKLQGAANVAIGALRDVNGFLQDQSPWKADKTDDDRKIIVRAVLEMTYALSHLLLPYLVHGASNVFDRLRTPPVALAQLNMDCRNLAAGTPVKVGHVLYSKSLSDSEKEAMGSNANKKETHADAQKRKKEEKAKLIAASQKGQECPGADPKRRDFTKMDIRVGKITKIWNHEDSDKLYCEQIDVGDVEGPREIASGLREHYELEDMRNRKVLVVCNLKPIKVVGFKSHGMVLAAKNPDGSKVELVDPPADAEVGERVLIDGLEGEPLAPNQVAKKKVWESVVPKLQVSQSGEASWDNKVIQTKTGSCKVASLRNVPIS